MRMHHKTTAVASTCSLILLLQCLFIQQQVFDLTGYLAVLFRPLYSLLQKYVIKQFKSKAFVYIKANSCYADSFLLDYPQMFSNVFIQTCLISTEYFNSTMKRRTFATVKSSRGQQFRIPAFVHICKYDCKALWSSHERNI